MKTLLAVGNVAMYLMIFLPILLGDINNIPILLVQPFMVLPYMVTIMSIVAIVIETRAEGDD